MSISSSTDTNENFAADCSIDWHPTADTHSVITHNEKRLIVRVEVSVPPALRRNAAAAVANGPL